MKIKKVYLGRRQIRPTNKREPWTDTYCYCPLQTDYLDYSWNNVAVTSDLTSFQTSNMFPWWEWKYVCIPQNDVVVARKDWTILFRVCPTKKNNSKVSTIAEACNWNSHNFNRWLLIETKDTNPIERNTFGTIWWTWWQWNLITCRHLANWYLELWINWTQPTVSNKKYGVDSEIQTLNLPVYFWRHVVYTSWYQYWLLWKMSDIIIEKKYRSNDEISNYYNQTKSKYGL